MSFEIPQILGCNYNENTCSGHTSRFCWLEKMSNISYVYHWEACFWVAKTARMFLWLKMQDWESRYSELSSSSSTNSLLNVGKFSLPQVSLCKMGIWVFPFLHPLCGAVGCLKYPAWECPVPDAVGEDRRNCSQELWNNLCKMQFTSSSKLVRVWLMSWSLRIPLKVIFLLFICFKFVLQEFSLAIAIPSTLLYVVIYNIENEKKNDPAIFIFS